MCVFDKKIKPNETIFFGFFIKQGKQIKAKETKQKNKVKRKVVKDSLVKPSLAAPATAPENLDGGSVECGASLGDPKRKV